MTFEWIGQFAEWLARPVPRIRIVDTRYGALKWVTVRLRDLLRGRWDPSAKLAVLGPGLHIYWPLFSVFIEYMIKRQTAPLPTQVITTTDNRQVAVAGVLTYDIFDLALAVGETHDTDDTIKDVGATCLYDALADHSYDELRAMQGRRLHSTLRNEARNELKKYGVNVIAFRLTTFAETRVYRLIQSSWQEGEILTPPEVERS
jgi:hypothetical protein